MRKNSPRKWLHATLDLLPVILIPVFMIYSHRHDVTENVAITYKYESNEVNTLDDLVEGNIYHLDSLYIDIGEYGDDRYTSFNILSYELVDSNLPSYSIDDFAFGGDYNSQYGNFIYVYVDDYSFILYFTNEFSYTSLAFDSGFIELQDIVIQVNDITVIENILNLSNNQLPQFTDYNVIESVDVENTDVMDSFMNHFNTTVNKHFNMGNVFNLGGVYQWFDTNIFGGHAPTVIYSVWNIALYELVMDLLFLLYGLFMWFIDMIQKLMEKPLDSVR